MLRCHFASLRDSWSSGRNRISRLDGLCLVPFKRDATNSVVAGSHIHWTKLKPLLIASLPTALLGGFIVLPEIVYDAVTGIVLLVAAAILVVGQAKEGTPDHVTPPWAAISTGAGVGFVSGLTGVGGGVFLAPILILMRWASPKQTAALSAPFILANSAVGLVGALYAGQSPSTQTGFYALYGLGSCDTIAGQRAHATCSSLPPPRPRV
jgi:uncharacterized membrane protein YfcA